MVVEVEPVEDEVIVVVPPDDAAVAVTVALDEIALEAAGSLLNALAAAIMGGRMSAMEFDETVDVDNAADAGSRLDLRSERSLQRKAQSLAVSRNFWNASESEMVSKNLVNGMNIPCSMVATFEATASFNTVFVGFVWRLDRLLTTSFALEAIFEADAETAGGRIVIAGMSPPDRVSTVG